MILSIVQRVGTRRFMKSGPRSCRSSPAGRAGSPCLRNSPRFGFLACYAYFGLTLAALKYCVLGFLLLGLIFTDAETFLLPDKMTLTGLGIGIIFSLIVPVNDLASQLLSGTVSLPLSSDVSWRLFSLFDTTAGAIVGASFIYGAGTSICGRGASKAWALAT